MRRWKRLAAVLLVLLAVLSLFGCTAAPAAPQFSEPLTPSQEQPLSPSPSGQPVETAVLDPDGWYYDLESVVLYLDTYGVLPSNFISKSDARALGWEGGSVERFLEGAAIGGDRFGKREGLLPQADGRVYTECDLNTNGADSRGAERLVFSNDGLYFYTNDHYESFRQLYVTKEGTVEWN